MLNADIKKRSLLNTAKAQQLAVGRLILTINYVNKRLHGLSPRANYTDRATAACRRSDWQIFVDRGCHVVSVTNPYVSILGFLDRSRYFPIK
jgi:hypothetical protein